MCTSTNTHVQQHSSSKYHRSMWSVYFIYCYFIFMNLMMPKWTKNQSKLVLARIFRQIWSLFEREIFFHFICVVHIGRCCALCMCVFSIFIIYLNTFVFFCALQILFGIVHIVLGKKEYLDQFCEIVSHCGHCAKNESNLTQRCRGFFLRSHECKSFCQICPEFEIYTDTHTLTYHRFFRVFLQKPLMRISLSNLLKYCRIKADKQTLHF